MYSLAAFPGCGKSWFTKQFPMVADSDSSQFPKDQFPKNYLDHIQARDSERKLTLISAHRDVREGLVQRNIAFYLVYPSVELKDEYRQRYLGRSHSGPMYPGDETAFADLLYKNWEDWLAQCHAQDNCLHYVMQSGEHLSDVFTVVDGIFQRRVAGS